MTDLISANEPARRRPTTLTRGLVEHLARRPEDCDLAHVQTSVAALDYDDAIARVLARATRDPIPAEMLALVYPHEDAALAVGLIGMAQGDRAMRLLELVERGEFSNDVMGATLRALALHAALLLDGPALRPRIALQVQRLARRWVVSGRSYVGAVFTDLGRAVGEPALVRHDDGSVAAETMVLRWALTASRTHLVRAALEALEPRATDPPPPEVALRPMVQRTAPTTGRNEPCPCGSGKKFKKCHGAPETGPPPTLLGSSPLTADQVLAMAYDQLILTDPVTLRDDALLAFYRRQLDAHALPAAERAVDKLAERSSFEPARIDQCRARLIEEAVVARRYGIAHRQFERLHDAVDAAVDPIALAGLALRMGAPEARDHLIRAAESAVSDASGLRALNLAHVLLSTTPALGILVARGAIRREDGWEPEILLDVIDEARVRLGLAPGDPATAVHDALGERLAAKRLRAEVEAVRLALHESAGRGRALESRVRELENQPRQASAAVLPPPDVSESLSDARTLRSRIDELQATLRDRNAERAELRRQLADVLVKATPAPEPRTPDEERNAPSNQDDDVGNTVELVARRIQVPSWERRSADALREVPAHVAAEALRTVASLAAADAAAWRAVKRAKGLDQPILLTRIGLHHRLLFEHDDEVLRVIDLVSRESLLGTLKRFRAG